MSTTDDRSGNRSGMPGTGSADMRLEVLIIPVSDADRAKDFYARLGWRLDADLAGDGFRLIQFTPPGSGCSVQFGTALTQAAPGSSEGTLLVVSDVQAVHDDLVRRGIEVGGVFHCARGGVCRIRDGDGVWERVAGPAPHRASYGSFATLSDPDGNSWVFQEVTTRLPGRVDAAETAFASVADLANAMRRASAAHGEHEKRIGAADPDWPDWYAAYMMAEQAGMELPR
ncbi:MAG TPA: VOC family protein [Streptosporangiaceae bacterium]|nr:VOC family protein [Streptosporangiaceae bacterium]